MNRMSSLVAAPTLAQVPTPPPERMHLLKGGREDQFAIDLVHPRRLVFAPNRDPIPRCMDGGVDRDQITEIIIIEVKDYH